jgi:hypothetical protein
MPAPILYGAIFSLVERVMSDALKQAEHYRDLEKRYRYLAEIGSSTKRRSYFLRIASHYGTLAEDQERLAAPSA